MLSARRAGQNEALKAELPLKRVWLVAAQNEV
jgi:hypothetical protein